jgi:hypothetical protein
LFKKVDVDYEKKEQSGFSLIIEKALVEEKIVAVTSISSVKDIIIKKHPVLTQLTC